MAQLVILGHKTRSKEVIEILEMLDGKVSTKLSGGASSIGYYINSIGNIDFKHYSYFDDAIQFTLEEFLEKYPYKVGDKVIAYAEGCLAHFTIQGMRWNYESNKVEYKICSSWYDASLIQSYKEETMDRKYDVEKYLQVWKETEKGLEVVVNDRFELKEDNGKFYIIKKQLQYPKTYEECAQILLERASIRNDIGYKGDLLVTLQRLLICRDAYWKIAGEQMGLGKPWKPDWKNDEQGRHMIMVYENKLHKDESIVGTNFILVFPTKEMRDAFYENFKELIESCKELL